jgi:hypothetical protein
VRPSCNPPCRPEPRLIWPFRWPQPITLTSGPRSHLVTLMDSAILIRDLEPFRQARPVWDRAAEMILIATETRCAPTSPRRRGNLLTAVIH